MNARAKLQDCQGGEGRLSLLTCRNVQWTDQEVRKTATYGLTILMLGVVLAGREVA